MAKRKRKSCKKINFHHFLLFSLAFHFVEVLRPFRPARGYTWLVMPTARRYLGRSIFGASIYIVLFLINQENPGLTKRNIRSLFLQVISNSQIDQTESDKWLLRHGIRSLRSSKLEITKVENPIQRFGKNCMDRGRFHNSPMNILDELPSSA